MNGKRAETAAASPVRAGKEEPGDLERLLGRAAAGDAAAFAVVYDQVAGAVYGLARTMAGDADWSPALAAEALTEVWRAAPDYDPSLASARSWVMRTARRHIASQVRAARNGNDDRNPDTLGSPGPADGAQDQALLLALHGGCTLDEISDRLGLTAQAAAGLIRSGLLRVAAGELTR